MFRLFSLNRHATTTWRLFTQWPLQRNRGFLKWWCPTTIGFPTKMTIFGCFGGTTILGNAQMVLCCWFFSPQMWLAHRCFSEAADGAAALLQTLSHCDNLEDSLVSSPSTCPWGSGIQIPRSYSTEIFLCEDLYMRCGWKIPSIGWEELSSAQWTKMKRVSFIKRLGQDPWELGRNWGVVESGVLSQSWPMLVKVLLSLNGWRTSQSWRRSADSHFG